MNLKALINAEVIKSTDEVPRGFQKINDQQFQLIMEGSNADKRFIVN
jgi:hypothetical protein